MLNKLTIDCTGGMQNTKILGEDGSAIEGIRSINVKFDPLYPLPDVQIELEPIAIMLALKDVDVSISNLNALNKSLEKLGYRIVSLEDI